MKVLFIFLTAILIATADSQSYGGWSTWTEWSECSGCDGTQERSSRCSLAGESGCSLGATRTQYRSCGPKCPECMNNLVEEGEECDCGTEEACEDHCCNATTCRWKSGIDCVTGECCDRNTCRFRERGVECRESKDECDFSEHCRGDTNLCPIDLYKSNKTHCNENKNYCFNGRCQNSSNLCKSLYGEEALNGLEDCYSFNIGGTLYGNCGENSVNDVKIYRKCDIEDVKCGLLHCVNADQLYNTSEYSYISNRRIRISDGTSTFICRGVYAITRTTNQVIGYVQDGTVCGTDKVCLQQQCVSLSTIAVPICPIGTNGLECSGHGFCTQTQECMCDSDRGGDACQSPISNGEWSVWENWSTCTLTCGNGLRYRTRRCDDPEPTNGGMECVGDNTQEEICNEGTCAVNGEWSVWENWSTCTLTCGNGTRYRTRRCDDPEPTNGGIECAGGQLETEICKEEGCSVNGEWSVWENWSTCTLTCGNGTRYRTRRCDDPEPTNGGMECVGNNTQEEICNEEPCAVNGEWSVWENWSTCTLTCGNGTRYRTRRCDDPEPTKGGMECAGNNTQEEICNEEPCPVDGGWGEWIQLYNCSATCGGGYTLDYRVCDNPAPRNGGSRCFGQSSRVLVCNTHSCTTTVPVDGGWGVWSSWSSCSVSCGNGTNSRTRQCHNPEPSGGGADCQGAENQTEYCNQGECSVDGGWGSWGEWGACSAFCGTSDRFRHRQCDTPVPLYGGEECGGDDYESDTCNGPPCVVPVDGGWGVWSSWSSCSVSCGNGTNSRTRQCHNPEPSGGGADCQGAVNQTEHCNQGECSVDGGWGSWGEWGACSAFCGTSDRFRHRQCDTPVPLYGGEECGGDDYESDTCNGPPCVVPVDGGWGFWSSWSSCSVSCGNGTNSRTRQCHNPEPSGGGADCQGAVNQTEYCNQGECSVSSSAWSIWSEWTSCDVTCGVSTERRQRRRDCEVDPECSQVETRRCDRVPCILYRAGGWSEWHEWAQCSQTCGSGLRERRRRCDNPTKGLLGQDCVGESIDRGTCDLSNCHGDIDGGWGDWDNWTECSATCGNGSRTRTRRCDNPEPTGSGSDCQGNNTESQLCNQTKCPATGVWGEWSGFGECSSVCGNGIRTRVRECTAVTHSIGDPRCEGMEYSIETCNTNQCAEWSGWSDWTACSRTCGRGNQLRERVCNATNPLSCPGARINSKECGLEPCTGVGEWGEWSGWSECSQTCGSGTQHRNRTCENMEPNPAVSSCNGDAMQVQACSNANCTMECSVSKYRVVSTCTEPCESNSVAFYARCIETGDVEECDKKPFRMRNCRPVFCSKQNQLSLSSQCYIWKDPVNLAPQCGTESEMVMSINRKLYCNASRILELSNLKFDLSEINFGCVYNSERCVRTNL